MKPSEVIVKYSTLFGIGIFLVVLGSTDNYLTAVGAGIVAASSCIGVVNLVNYLDSN
jgi:hypothetical protein